jgi:hypothetical protein
MDFKWVEKKIPSTLHHTHSAIHQNKKTYFFCAKDVTKYFNKIENLILYEENSETFTSISTRGIFTNSDHKGIFYKNFIYLFGHQTVKFDTTNNSFETLLEGNLPRYTEYRCVSSINHKVYVFGGLRREWPGEPIMTNDLFSFDMEEEKWNFIKPIGSFIPKPRRYSSMVSKDFDLFIFGGRDEEERFNDLWKFNTINERWQEINTMGVKPSPRAAHSMNLKDSSIFIFGGNDDSMSNELFELDLFTNQWKLIDCQGKILGRYWHTSYFEGNLLNIQGGWSNDLDDYFVDLHSIKISTKKNIPHISNLNHFSDCLIFL